ncbi:helix-turn-helix transcriptional regulator [Rhizobacter sp. AJA081-3]|uniref:helix-turn-helix transcriptional regulator n=1 Tax=Rhizobacter sp. AJA081-3 TaxID=2753607 RepID=UPI001ADF56B2|nr:substrate-binding domain-containing protein [Rhizobacter sp. AJA081-3]QTN21705.1 helix-turn-helix transcriptional regulator [Rhizobacter sp. AJA081-3]
MHRVSLTYTLAGREPAQRDLHHPLMALLAAVHDTGSISAAARQLQLSYRHVWGELKRWEGELGQTLVVWVKGQPALLSPFGEKLLWAERRAQARLAPQIEALRSELEQAFAIAFDASAGVIPMTASHDDALPLLRALAQTQHKLHLDIQFSGSVDALAALNDGRCLMAGFHALTESPLRSPTAKVYRPMLKPGHHKLVSFARRTQGLMVAPGNPLGIESLADLCRANLRFANRSRGTGTRVVLEELLAQQKIAPERIGGFETTEPSHRAAAEAVASGSADASFGIEAAATARGLDFVPLAREQYFLVTLQHALDQPQVQTLLSLLRSEAWRAQLNALPGYAAEGSGEVLSLRRVLPWWSYRKPKRASP